MMKIEKAQVQNAHSRKLQEMHNEQNNLQLHINNLRKLELYIAQHRLKEMAKLKLDVIYYKFQVESLISSEIELVKQWYETQDVTKRKIENSFISFKWDEILYRHKLPIYMNAFPQFLYEPLKIKLYEEDEETNTSFQSLTNNRRSQSLGRN